MLTYRITEIDDDGKPVESNTHPTGGYAQGQAAALSLVAELMEFTGARSYRIHFIYDTATGIDQAALKSLPESEWTWDSDIVRTYNPEV